MTLQLVMVLVLLAGAIAMFAINKPRMDAVGLIMLTLLPFTGAVNMNEALSGFSDSNIVLIAALFVIGDGLVRTGVARQLGDWLIAKAGNSDTKLLVLLMVVVCGLGSVMSSTAVTAIFIPVALRISQSTGTSPSRLMMPLSMAALISGMMTLVATAPNLVVNSELIRSGAAGFQFFSFTPFGLPILVLGIVYMSFARKWLSAGNGKEADGSLMPTLNDWIRDYKLAGREHRVRVTAGSPLVGKTLEELDLRDRMHASLVAIERGPMIIQPTAKTELRVGDILLVDLFAAHEDIATLREQLGVEVMPLSGPYFTERSQEIGMAEVIVPASSELIGLTIVNAKFRSKHGVSVIGIRRGNSAIDEGLRDEALKMGDVLLLIGPWKAMDTLRSDSRNLVLLNLPAEHRDVLPAAGKAPQAVACLVLVVGLMISGLIPIVQAALIGCLLMGALKCVNLESSYRSIDWKTIVLIVGMLPFSTALQRSGGVDLMANGLMSVIGGAGTHVVLASIFIITAILGLFISNTATAVLMAPVALAIAKELHLSPYPFAMIVALAASTAFMTPVSSPVNTLVVTPGNYTFGDFLKVGVPFSIVVMIVCVIMVPLILPL